MRRSLSLLLQPETSRRRKSTRRNTIYPSYIELMMVRFFIRLEPNPMSPQTNTNVDCQTSSTTPHWTPFTTLFPTAYILNGPSKPVRPVNMSSSKSPPQVTPRKLVRSSTTPSSPLPMLPSFWKPDTTNSTQHGALSSRFSIQQM